MDSLQEWFNTLLFSIGTAVATWFGMRRRYSRDTTVIAHDRAEKALLDRLTTERDEARDREREAVATRLEDVKKIARLEALLETYQTEVLRLRDEVLTMRLHSRRLTSIIVKLAPDEARMLGIDKDSDGIPEEFPSSRPMPL